MHNFSRLFSISLMASLFTAGCALSDKPEPAFSASSCNSYQHTLSELQEDVVFQSAFIDIDEWRETPVRHRYVHGGFTNTDTRFSFYYPEKDSFEGRFFHYITPLPMSETVSQGADGADDKIGFSLQNGAYFVETNTGGRNQADATIGAFRANAAAAQYSRLLAMEHYSSCDRPFGYAFGGSGGAFRTIGGMENTDGVWDGAVPFVVGSPMAIPSVFTARMYAMRVLKDKLPGIVDAIEPGSKADPFDGLTKEESAALNEVTKLGFPLHAWYAYKTLDMHGLIVLFPTIQMMDASYFTDFWTKPGYEGYRPPASLLNAIVEYQSPIKQILYSDTVQDSALASLFKESKSRGLADDAFRDLVGNAEPGIPLAIELENIPQHDLLGAEIYIRSGEHAGRKLAVKQFIGNFVVLSSDPMVGGDKGLLKSIRKGELVEVNNKNILALQTYHRHQVPEDGYSAWDQFRDENGEPIYPQRPMLLGPLFTQGASGTVPTGKFNGKMIVLANLHDTEAYPWQGDWYFQQARSHLGESTDGRIRLWYTDHANHNDATKQLMPTHTVGYLGVLQQALLDLSKWVEQGIEPAASSNYEIVDAQVHIPESANERAGIQPVVLLTANGKKRAEVSVGEAVQLTAQVSVPENKGFITSVEWDVSDTGHFVSSAEIEAKRVRHAFEHTHVFDAPGTYFITVKVAAEREGDSRTPFAQVYNLDRVRVVVNN